MLTSLGIPERGTYILQWLGHIDHGGIDVEERTVEALYVPVRSLIDACYAADSDVADSVTANVSVSMWRQLRLGKIFIDGKAQPNVPGLEEFTFHTTGNRHNVISADAADSQGKSIVPFVASLPARFRRTRLLLYKMGPCRDRVLIPCSEVIRYFYAADGQFVRHLFSGRFLLDLPYSGGDKYAFDGVRFIRSKKEVAWSRFAAKQVRMIYGRNIALKQFDGYNVVEALLPFRGPWSVICRAVRYVVGGRPYSLVLNILHAKSNTLAK